MVPDHATPPNTTPADASTIVRINEDILMRPLLVEIDSVF